MILHECSLRQLRPSLRACVVLAFVGSWAALAGGCALPEYHMPAGFSSTYHRHLFADRQSVLAPDPDDAGQKQADADAGFLYPVTIHHGQQPRTAEGAPNEPLATASAGVGSIVE